MKKAYLLLIIPCLIGAYMCLREASIATSEADRYITMCDAFGGSYCNNIDSAFEKAQSYGFYATILVVLAILFGFASRENLTPEEKAKRKRDVLLQRVVG